MPTYNIPRPTNTQPGAIGGGVPGELPLYSAPPPNVPMPSRVAKHKPGPIIGQITGGGTATNTVTRTTGGGNYTPPKPVAPPTGQWQMPGENWKPPSFFQQFAPTGQNQNPFQNAMNQINSSGVMNSIADQIARQVSNQHVFGSGAADQALVTGITNATMQQVAPYAMQMSQQEFQKGQNYANLASDLYSRMQSLAAQGKMQEAQQLQQQYLQANELAKDYNQFQANQNQQEWENRFRENQFNWQKDQADRNYELQQQRGNAYGGGGGGGGGIQGFGQTAVGGGSWAIKPPTGIVNSAGGAGGSGFVNGSSYGGSFGSGYGTPNFIYDIGAIGGGQTPFSIGFGENF